MKTPKIRLRLKIFLRKLFPRKVPYRIVALDPGSQKVLQHSLSQIQNPLTQKDRKVILDILLRLERIPKNHYLATDESALSVFRENLETALTRDSFAYISFALNALSRFFQGVPANLWKRNYSSKDFVKSPFCFPGTGSDL